MKEKNPLLSAIEKVNSAFLGIETFLLALITITLVLTIFIEVVCRYFLFISVAWAEELTRYLFIWLTYIGSAYALYEGSHTEIDIVSQLIDKSKKDDAQKAKAKKILEFFTIVSSTAFLVVFGKIFWDYMMKIWHSIQTSPTMHIPMGLVYLPVFIGVVLCIFHEIVLFIKLFVDNTEESASGEEVEVNE